MKKVLFSIILGIALLGPSAVVSAEQNRSTEPRWGIRPERAASPAPVDFARWLARHLTGAVGFPLPLPSEPAQSPTPGPVTTRPGSEPNEVCVPERGHCPVG